MQRQPAGRHLAGQRLQRALTLAHDAQPAQGIAARIGQGSGCREQPVQSGVRCFDRLAEGLDQSGAYGACRRYRDLLAQHRAHRQLETIGRAGHAQAIGRREARLQRGVDGDRVGIEVQHRANPADDSGQYRRQRFADPQQQLFACRVEAHVQPAGVRATGLVDAQRACQRRDRAVCARRVRHRCNLDASQRPPREEGQHGCAVVRWPKTQAHVDGVVGRQEGAPGHRHLRGLFGLAHLAGQHAHAPHGTRVQAVMPDERRVEAPHAGKPAGKRNLRHRQPCVGDQLLGDQQPASLQVLQRRNAKLRLENAPQVAIADAQPGCDVRRSRPADAADATHTGTVRAPRIRFVDQPHRLLRQHARGILGRPVQRTRRQFGPAAQAGPEAPGLGLRRVAEKHAVLALWQLDATDGPAVDAGRGHRREKRAVESRVVRLHREVARVALQRRCGGRQSLGHFFGNNRGIGLGKQGRAHLRHASMIRSALHGNWPFPDIRQR